MKQITLTSNITKQDSESLNKYFRDISKINLLTSEEETALVRQIKAGDKRAKNKLIRANLRFVVSVAKHYQNGPVPLSDLINEGNIGLIKAAERFDETRGFKFISYAVWWIRQSILAALDEQSRLIKIPSNKLSNMSCIRKAMDYWEKTHERSATVSELAELLEMEERDVLNDLKAMNIETSLDTPIDWLSEGSALDFIPHPDSKAEKEQNLNYEELKDLVKKILGRLKVRERDVLEMSFGINHASPHSLEEISQKLGISRERVRQIKEKTLRKLSFHGLRKKIKGLALS